MVEMASGIPENVEKSEPAVGRVRRNSTGSVGFETGESKVLSRYLGVPAGSCHDLCKLGFEHDSPAKLRIPRPTRCGATLGKFPERKKLPNSSKLHFDIPASTNRVAAFANHQIDSKLNPSEEYTPMPRRLQRRHSDIFIPGRSSKLQECLLDGSRSRRSNSSIGEKDGGSSEISKKKNVISSTVSLSPKSSVKNNESTTTSSGSNNPTRKVSQLNCRTSHTQSKASQTSHENVPKKTSHLRDSKTKSQTAGISRGNSNFEGSSLDRDSSKQAKTSLSPPHSPSSSPSSSDSNSRNIINSQSSISSSSLNSVSSASENDSFNSDAADSSTRQTETTSQKKDKKPQRTGKAGLENEDCGPKILKFKKGKINDPQSEKGSPRRQKFRQVIIKDEDKNENCDLRGKILRRSTSDSHSDTAKDEVLQVNLRPQAIEDKKKPPSLFNNVIEVTASKLAEIRRSKVKGLVGAFETIISLQGPKSSPAIGRS